MFEQELKKLEPEINKLITSQLGKGIKGDGSKIVPQYSDQYAKKKGKKTPDLKVSGSFWDSIKITSIQDNIAQIEGNLTNKGFDVAKHHEKRYTSGIYELTKQNRDIIFAKLNSNILIRINNELKG